MIPIAPSLYTLHEGRQVREEGIGGGKLLRALCDLRVTALVTYPPNPAQNAQDYLNPKSETRISKQIENSNAGKNTNLRCPDCFFLSFPLLYCFGFRVLRFGFPGEVFGSGFAGLGWGKTRDRPYGHPFMCLKGSIRPDGPRGAQPKAFLRINF